MFWRDYLALSQTAIQLEEMLNPKLIEHDGGLKSTAFTDVENKTINLDVSQTGLKCALSYVYELKNLENSDKYKKINQQAEMRSITKSDYIRSIILLEAEAVYFRCQVFEQMGAPDSDFPCRREYLSIYNANKTSFTKENTIQQLVVYILDNAIVRREYPAKKYYADCYDFYAKKRPWPRFYDERPSSSVVIVDQAEPGQREFKP